MNSHKRGGGEQDAQAFGVNGRVAYWHGDCD
jgi:hypothetical protein